VLPVSEELAKAVEKIRMDANFCSTWTLLQSMADIYEQFNIIDGEWLAVINKRYEKNKDRYDEMLKKG